MFVRFGHVLLIFALLCATGAHWAVLQSVAWASMLAENSRTDDLATAIVKTFDGKHPCSLCKQVTKGSREQTKSEARADLQRLEFCHQPVTLNVTAPRKFPAPQTSVASAALRADAPPVPPPRAFGA